MDTNPQQSTAWPLSTAAVTYHLELSGANTTWSPTPQRGHTSLKDLCLLYLAIFLMTVIVVLGTAGNCLVIAAMKTTRRLRSPSNLLILNLSCCDLLFVTAVLPFNIYTYLADGWFMNINLCKFVGFMGYSLTGTILISICLIAWNRFKLVTDPGGYKTTFTIPKVLVMLAASWLIPALCLLPSLLELWGRFGYVAMLVTCNLLLSHDSQSFKVALLTTRAMLPCVLLAYCYFMIYKLSRRSHAKLHHYGAGRSATYRMHSKRNERHLSQMICVIFLVFALSYFPCAITGLVDWSTVLSKKYHMYCEITVYIGSAVNPLIYGLMNSQFRDAYLALLCGGRHTAQASPDKRHHKAPPAPVRRRSSLMAVVIDAARDLGQRAAYNVPLLPADIAVNEASHGIGTVATLASHAGNAVSAELGGKGSRLSTYCVGSVIKTTGGRLDNRGCRVMGHREHLHMSRASSGTDSTLSLSTANLANTHPKLGSSPTSSCASGVTDSTLSSFCQ